MAKELKISTGSHNTQPVFMDSLEVHRSTPAVPVLRKQQEFVFGSFLQLSQGRRREPWTAVAAFEQAGPAAAAASGHRTCV